jgi:hypothetical protein
MQFKLEKTFVIMGAIAVLAYGCGGGGDDDGVTPTPTPTPAASLSGTLSQTYVKGATIIADKIVAGTTLGNYLLDTGEVSTTSDDNGQFALEVPAGYNGYVLFSKGGMLVNAAGNSVPARPMLAPAGARNITPVTTLAALNPDLVSQMGAQYDADIANAAGVSGEVLQLAKIAEAILDLLSADDNQVVTDMADKFAVLQHVADDFDGVDLSDDSAVNAATATAVGNILDDEAIVPASMFADTDSKQAIADSFSQTIQTITAAIDQSAETVMESDVQAECESAVESGVGEVSTKFKTVSTQITVIQFLDSDNVILDQIQTAGFTGTKNLTATVANQISKIAFGLTGNNDFAAASSYLGVSIPVTIIDANSQRKATVACTNVDVTVAADGTITITTSDETQLEINGTNSAGEQVVAKMDNIDATDAISDIVSPNGQSIIFDFDALSAKIEAELGSDSDLYEIGSIGDYTISITAEGEPLASFTGKLAVE